MRHPKRYPGPALNALFSSVFALLTLAAPAAAQNGSVLGPGTVIGENLIADPTSISGGGSCSGINGFGVTGTAVGPYPGTFFEGGSIPVDSNNVGHFQAKFQITAG